MNIFIRIIGIAALMTGITTGAAAQEQPKDSAKVGFFRQAFRDMKESAKRQREIEARQEAAQKRIDEAKGNK